MLYEAQIKSAEDDMTNVDNNKRINKIDISNRLSELKNTKQLASMLTINGASLFDLLGKEVQLREMRNSKVNRQFDTSDIEIVLKEIVENTKKEIEDTKQQIDNVKVNYQQIFSSNDDLIN